MLAPVRPAVVLTEITVGIISVILSIQTIYPLVRSARECWSQHPVSMVTVVALESVCAYVLQVVLNFVFE